MGEIKLPYCNSDKFAKISKKKINRVICNAISWNFFFITSLFTGNQYKITNAE